MKIQALRNLCTEGTDNFDAGSNATLNEVGATVHGN